MHFLELHLKAFGHFTDYCIDFPPREAGCGLHLIVGNNEAGKSTVLAAIERLLFGFSKSDGNYDFVHRPNKLLIGARIGNVDGGNGTFLRRKTSDALTTLDGKTELPKLLFESELDALTPSQYMRLFGLDQQRLRQGGIELVNCEGDFARILFAESLGELDRFEVVRKELELTASKLFRPGARGKATMPLNQVKTERDLIQKELLESTTTAQTWNQLQQDLEREVRSRTELDERLEKLRHVSNRLERLNRSQEAIRELDKRTDRIAAFGHLPEVSDDLRTEFAQAEEQSKAAMSRLADTEADIAELTQKIESTRLDEILLSFGDRIERLARKSAAIESIRSKFDSRQEAISIGMSDFEDRLKSLGFESCDSAQLPRPFDPRIQRLKSIKEEIDGLKESISGTTAAIDALKMQLRVAESELSRIPQPRDVAHIDTALLRLQSMQERMSSLDSLRKNRSKCDRLITSRLNALPLWEGSLADFESLKLPDFELAGKDADRFESMNRVRLEAENDAKKISRELNEKKEILANRLAEFEIPSPGELANSRKERDDLWMIVKARWIDDRNSHSDPLNDRDLAQEFESRTKRSDRLADVLRDHLETVKLQGECLDLEVHAKAAERRLAECEAQTRQARESWIAHFRFLETEPVRPDEIRQWPEMARSILELIEERDSINDSIDRIEKEWTDCVSDVVEPLLDENRGSLSSFDLCRSEIQSLRDRVVKENADRQSRSARANECRESVDRNLAKLDEENRRLDLATIAWSEQLTECGFPSFVGTESFETVSNSIASILQEAKRLESERSRLQEDIQEVRSFEMEVDSLANEIRFTEVSSDPVRIAESMRNRLIQERESSKALVRNRSSLEKEIEAREIALASLKKAKSRITEICIKIGADRPEAAQERFETIALRNAEKREADKALARLDSLRNEEPLDRWIEDSRNFAPENANRMIEESRSEIEKLNSTRDSISEAIFAIDREARRIRDSVTSAESLAVEQRRKAFFEDTRARVSQYLKCQLTMQVLKDAAESYRKRMGQQVIDDASINLKSLSYGSLEGVITTDVQGKRKLVAIRSKDQDYLDLHQLSEGARDQLFLSLKVAMIRNRLMERRRKGKGPLPVIFDDVLVNFDDDRAAAAFRLFEELAKSTQVIYLTHHRHLESVARAAIGDSAFRIHRLSISDPNDKAGAPELITGHNHPLSAILE
ncbi:AAA family ATPase [bacterium]|nr:AAA family ATPase [bacterium]